VQGLTFDWVDQPGLGHSRGEYLEQAAVGERTILGVDPMLEQQWRRW